MIGRLLALVVVLWLAIGAIAAAQRGYFDSSHASCAQASTDAVTVVAGPLNYAGVNPKVTGCEVPQPSN